MGSAQRSLRGFQSATMEAEGKTTGLFGTILGSGTFGNLFAAGIQRATGAVTNFGRGVIAQAMQMQQSQMAFEQFLGSAEAASTKLEELRKFSAATPFEFPDLVNSTKKMMALGFSADEVLTTIKNADGTETFKGLAVDIGDTAAMLGMGTEGVDRITTALGRMQLKGKVTGEEMMMLTEAGIGGWQYLADAIGKPVAEVQKMTEKGLIPAAVAIEALRAGMQKDFGGGMIKQSETLEGLLSTLKDTVFGEFVKAAGPLVKTISDITKKIIALAQKAIPAMAGGLQKGLDAIIPLADTLLPTVGDAVVNLATILSEAFSNVAPAMGGMLKGFTALAPVLSVMVGIAGTLATAFGALPGPLQQLIVVVAAVMALMRTSFMQTMVSATSAAGASMTRFGQTVQMRLALTRMEFANTSRTAQLMGATIAVASVVGSTAMQTLKAAARSLWASLGPIGVAMIGLSVAFEVFTRMSNDASSATDDNAKAAQEFASTLSFANGVLDQNSEKLLANKLAQDGIYTSLAQLGISTSEYTAAIIAGGPQLDAMRARIQGLVADNTQAADRFGTSTKASNAMGEAALAVLGPLGAYSTAISNAASTATQAATAVDGLSQATGTASAAADQHAAAEERRKAALDAAKAAFETMSSLISQQGSADAAIRGAQALGEAVKKNGKSFEATTEAGLANRDALRDAVNAALTYAQSFENPKKQASVLKSEVGKLRGAMKDMGLKPGEINALLAPFNLSKEKLKETVDAVKSAESKASTNGQAVGSAITDGVINGMLRRKAEMIAEAYAVGKAAADAVKRGAQSQSPSRITTQVGEDIGNGVVVGINNVRNNVVSVSRALGRTAAINVGQGMANQRRRAVKAAEFAVADAQDAVASARAAVGEAKNARERAKALRELTRAQWALREAQLASASAGRDFDRGIADSANSALTRIKDRAKAALDLITQTADAMKSFGSITTLQVPEGGVPALADVLGNMKGRLDAIRKFGSTLEKLRKMNLRPEVLQQIISAGPVQGGAIAEAILAAGQRGVSQVNQAQAALVTASADIGNIASMSQFGMTRDQARAVQQTNVTVERGAVTVNFGEGIRGSDRSTIINTVNRAVREALAAAAREGSR